MSFAHFLLYPFLCNFISCHWHAASLSVINNARGHPESRAGLATVWGWITGWTTLNTSYFEHAILFQGPEHTHTYIFMLNLWLYLHESINKPLLQKNYVFNIKTWIYIMKEKKCKRPWMILFIFNPNLHNRPFSNKKEIKGGSFSRKYIKSHSG